MKKTKLPKTDSIQKLAEFWDTHDLTDFNDQLEEVAEPVFARDTAIKLHLQPSEAKAVAQLAQGKGVSREELIRTWVVQKLTRRRTLPAGKRKKVRDLLNVRSKEPAATPLAEYRKSLG